MHTISNSDMRDREEDKAVSTMDEFTRTALALYERIPALRATSTVGEADPVLNGYLSRLHCIFAAMSFLGCACCRT